MSKPVTLYDFQQRAVDIGWNLTRDPYAPAPHRVLIGSPTGSGKSYMEAALLAKLRDAGIHAGIITSSPTIARQLIAKGAPEEHVWSSPITYRNAVGRGELAPYDVLIVDEAHHSVADTYADAICGSAKTVGFTATPYRGTARETERLHEMMGKPHVVLTNREAHDRDDLTFRIPSFRIKPLYDDDVLTPQGEDFNAAEVDKLVGPHLETVLRDALESFHAGYSTVAVLPSTALARAAEKWLAEHHADTPVAIVLGDTSLDLRDDVYAEAVAAKRLLVTVAVLREGIDLALARMHNLRPIRSPVAAMQLWGRMCRHADAVIYEYGRNVERHAHLWEGHPPIVKAVVETQIAFGGPSKRGAAVSRALDIEAVGKYKCVPIPLIDGGWAESYTLYATDSPTHDRGEYVIVMAPHAKEPVCAFRPNRQKPWRKSTVPVDLEGYRTHTGKDRMSTKQEAWYRKNAAGVGLDPEADLSSRQFSIFAALKESYQHVRVE